MDSHDTNDEGEESGKYKMEEEERGRMDESGWKMLRKERFCLSNDGVLRSLEVSGVPTYTIKAFRSFSRFLLTNEQNKFKNREYLHVILYPIIGETVFW